MPPDKVADFVASLPLRKIPGVGQKTAEKLAKLGLHLCRDIQQADLNLLVKEFGSFAEVLLERSQGIDLRAVEPERERKSVAVEHTFSQDLLHLEQGHASLAELYQKLIRRIERCDAQHQIQKIGVKLKFQDFRQTTIERQHPELNFDILQPIITTSLATWRWSFCSFGGHSCRIEKHCSTSATWLWLVNVNYTGCSKKQSLLGLRKNPI